MLPHPEITAASEVGHYLLVDDRNVRMVVSWKGEAYLECTVESHFFNLFRSVSCFLFLAVKTKDHIEFRNYASQRLSILFNAQYE